MTSLHGDETQAGRVWRFGCDDCVMAATPTCRDCVVTHLFAATDADAGPQAVVLDLDEFRAVRRLQSVGLLPDSRYRADPEATAF